MYQAVIGTGHGDWSFRSGKRAHQGLKDDSLTDLRLTMRLDTLSGWQTGSYGLSPASNV